MKHQLERDRLFTEVGVKDLLTLLSSAQKHIKEAGAVKASTIMRGDTFFCMNAFDFLVENGYLREVTGSDVFGQDRVFTA